MWACAFRATFISSISFIYLLILLYSHSFSKHCHSLHSSREEAQNPFPKTARLAAKSVCVYQDPYVGEGRWAAYTHTHTPQVQSANQITRLATLQFAGVRSVQVLKLGGDSQRPRLCLAQGCHYRNHLRAQSCEFVNLSAGPGVVSDQTIDARS